MLRRSFLFILVVQLIFWQTLTSFGLAPTTLGWGQLDQLLATKANGDAWKHTADFKSFQEHSMQTLFRDVAQKHISDQKPPVVFISYAWPVKKYPEEQRLQEQLQRIRSDLMNVGIEVQLDLYNLGPGIDIKKFMHNGIQRSDAVLLIGTRSLQERSALATNVAIEKNHILNKRQINSDFDIIPLLYSGTFEESFPEELQADKSQFESKQHLFDISPTFLKSDKAYYMALIQLAGVIHHWDNSTKLDFQDSFLKQWDEWHTNVDQDQFVTFQQSKQSEVEAKKRFRQEQFNQMRQHFALQYPDFVKPQQWFIPTTSSWIRIGQEDKFREINTALEGVDTSEQTAVLLHPHSDPWFMERVLQHYCWEHVSQYTAGFYAELPAHSSIRDIYTRMAYQIGLTDIPRREKTLIKAVNDYLEDPAHSGWVWVISQPKSVSALRSKLPKKGGVILISQKSKQARPLPLSRNDNASLFKHVSGQSLNDGDVDQLNNYSPGFIVRLAQYLSRNMFMTLDDMREQLRRHAQKFSRWIYEHTLAQESNLTMNQGDSSTTKLSSDIAMKASSEWKDSWRSEPGDHKALEQAYQHYLLIKEKLKKLCSSKPPRVFIAYSFPKNRDDYRLLTWMMQLKNELEDFGIQVDLDLSDQDASSREAYANLRIAQSDVVLVIATPELAEEALQNSGYMVDVLQKINEERYGNNKVVIPIIQKGDFSTSIAPLNTQYKYNDLLAIGGSTPQSGLWPILPELIGSIYGLSKSSNQDYSQLLSADQATSLQTGDDQETTYAQLDREQAAERQARRHVDRLSQYNQSLRVQPHLWNILPPRASFAGRDNDLESLSSFLMEKSDDKKSRIAIIRGMGGLGKSQLAYKYAFDHQTLYTMGYHLDASSAINLLNDFTALAEQLGIDTRGVQSDALIETVKQLLSDPKYSGWLLLFDNVQSIDDIKQYLPEYGGSVVMTTRQAGLLSGLSNTREIVLDAMDQESGRRLLRMLLGSKDASDPQLDQLAQRLNYSPLLLQQVAAYIREQAGLTVESYLEQTDLGSTELQTDAILMKTLDPSLEYIDSLSREARDMLCFLAFLSPQGIPFWIIEEWYGQYYKKAYNMDQKHDLTQNLLHLQRMSFVHIHRSSRTVTIHPILQDVLRDKLTPKQKEKYMRQAVGLMTKNFRFNYNDPQTWAVVDELIPHLQYLAMHALDDQMQQATMSELLTDRLISYISMVKGNLPLAHNVWNQALHLQQSLYGEGSLKLGYLYVHQAELFYKEGNYANAVRVINQAVPLLKQQYGANHSNMSMTYVSQAKYLLANGQVEEAEAAINESLRISRWFWNRWLMGPYQSYIHRVAAEIYAKKNDLAQALQHIRQSLDLAESLLGPRHTDTGVVCRWMGEILAQNNQLDEADGFFKRAIDILSGSLELEHLMVAEAKVAYAQFLQGQQKIVQAGDVLGEALQVRIKKLGRKHQLTQAIEAQKLTIEAA